MKNLPFKIIYFFFIFTCLLGGGKVLSRPAQTEPEYPDKLQGLPLFNNAGLTLKGGGAFKSNFSALQVAVNFDRQSENTNYPIQNIVESKAPELQAQQLYESGRYAEASLLLHQIAADSAAKGDELGQAMALRNLSLVYQKTGQWSAAKQAISESLNLLQKSDSSRHATFSPNLREPGSVATVSRSAGNCPRDLETSRRNLQRNWRHDRGDKKQDQPGSSPASLGAVHSGCQNLERN
jgi:tetratricopeptide (TPR) repeat protein